METQLTPFLSLGIIDYLNCVSSLKYHLRYSIDKCSWLKKDESEDSLLNLLIFFQRGFLDCRKKGLYPIRLLDITKHMLLRLVEYQGIDIEETDIEMCTNIDCWYNNKTISISDVSSSYRKSLDYKDGVHKRKKAEWSRMALMSAVLERVLISLPHPITGEKWSQLLSSFCLLFFEVFMTLGTSLTKGKQQTKFQQVAGFMVTQSRRKNSGKLASDFYEELRCICYSGQTKLTAQQLSQIAAKHGTTVQRVRSYLWSYITKLRRQKRIPPRSYKKTKQ